MQATLGPVDLTKGPRGWTQPFRQGGAVPRTMVPQDPTPVVVPSGDPETLPLYGWVSLGPLEQMDLILGSDLLVADHWDGYIWHVTADQVREPSGGCGCGNPFARCHPDA